MVTNTSLKLKKRGSFSGRSLYKQGILVAMEEHSEDHNETDEKSQTTSKQKNQSRQAIPAWKRTLLVAGALVGILVLINASYVGYLYAQTPLNIRQPLYEHYHYRMQILVDGKPVNFATKAFQEGYSKDNCNAALTTHPIHFHDDKDQFVHIHWEGLTGGQVLKYYGWNFIGGTKGSLGYRFDTLPKLQKVAIHGNELPAIPESDQFYIYSGDENGFKQQSFNDFTGQDLEKFFGKVSNSPAHNLNKQKRGGLAAMLSPKVSAMESDNASGLSGEQLTRLNNLIGNVVIFVQKQKPGDAQIKERFNHLEPLSDSACGG